MHIGLRLGAIDGALDRWSPGADDVARTAVYELLFAMVEGRAAAYSLRAVDTRRRTLEASVTDDVVVRMRLSDDDRIHVLGIGPAPEERAA